MQVGVEARDNGNNQGRTKATSTNNTNRNDVMQSYNAKMGYFEVRFVTGNSNVCNVGRALTQFLASAIYGFAFGWHW
jgi:hypothetical protein